MKICRRPGRRSVFHCFMKVPGKIKKIIGTRSYTENTVGKSGARVLCFDDMVLKIGAGEEEAVMMEWLSGRLPVPEILACEREEGASYLLMSKVKGDMLCAETYLRRPALLTELLAEGLKLLWSVDPSGCPCAHATNQKLKLAESRVENGLCDREGVRAPDRLLAWLKTHQPAERPVFTHGDCCLPNLFTDGKKITGFLDLGACGIADPYQDLALAYRSLRDNLRGKYGGIPQPGADPERLFKKLDIVPDRKRLRYYMLLDELL